MSTAQAACTRLKIACGVIVITFAGKAGPPMTDNPLWEICERVAEIQALLDDHLAGGKHSAADVVGKAQAVLSEPELLRAMFDVGYFPPNTPPYVSIFDQTATA